MKLAFSTLACPQWSTTKIIDNAVRLGYQGLELDILDGKKIEPVGDAAKIKRAVEESRARSIEICAFDTSCTFNHPSLEARHEQVDTLRQWLRLAHDLHVPIVRVFGGEAAATTGVSSPDESTKEERRVAEALHHTLGQRMVDTSWHSDVAAHSACLDKWDSVYYGKQSHYARCISCLVGHLPCAMALPTNL